jgi:hypothetical protein
MVKYLGPISTATGRTKRVEKLCAKRIIVVGVEVKAVRRLLS